MNQQQTVDSEERLFSALKTPIKIIARNKGDTVTAAVMLTKILQEQETWFSLTFHNEQTAAKNVIDAHYKTHLFLDVIPPANTTQRIIVAAQQDIQSTENISILKVPTETSISSYVYHLLKTKTKTSLIPYALLGEKLAKKELNQEIVNEAIMQEVLDNTPAAELFSALQTPVNKLIEQAHEYYIPDVTGSSVGAVNLLQEANIQKPNTLWQKYNELRKEEKERLAEAISKKIGVQKQTLYKQYYLWLKHWSGKTIDEVAGVIHACITLQKPAIAYGYCLQHSQSEELAQQILNEYHQHLMAAVHWYKEESKKNILLQKEKACVIVKWYDLQEAFIKEAANLFFRMEKNSAMLSIIFILRGTLEGKLCISVPQNHQKQEMLAERLKQLAQTQELQFLMNDYLSVTFPLAKEESVLQQVKEIITAIACEEYI